MRSMFIRSFSAMAVSVVAAATSPAQDSWRRLPVGEYRDRMKAGWIGQIAGVALGAPTEFKFRDRIIPADQVPSWRPEMINNAFGQDDLCVEMRRPAGLRSRSRAKSEKRELAA